MSKTPWIKWYSGDFLNGVADLTPHEIALYTIILCRIYDEDGPVPHDTRKLARRCNMRLPQCEKALLSLLESGKLISDGSFIDNNRALNEREKRQETSVKQADNIAHRWQKDAKKPNKNNNGPIPRKKTADTKPIPTRSQKPEAREKKNIKKKNIPKVKKVDLDDMKIWARERGLTVSVAGEYEKYLDWGIAHGKRHKDERAGFRNWLRAAQKFSGDGAVVPKTADQVEYDAHAAKLAKGRIVRAEISQARERAEKYGFDLDDDLARISKEHGEPMDQLRALAAGK